MVYLMAKGDIFFWNYCITRNTKEVNMLWENVFDILRKTFMELFTKNDLNVSFVPNAFTMGCLLHNLL